MGHFLSSQYVLTTFYTIGTLDPSEVILLMAGAQPKKVTMWDAALKPRPRLRYPGLENRFGWWRITLFDVNDCSNRHDKRLCRNVSRVTM